MILNVKGYYDILLWSILKEAAMLLVFFWYDDGDIVAPVSLSMILNVKGYYDILLWSILKEAATLFKVFLV
jgi:hypothetical protein